MARNNRRQKGKWRIVEMELWDRDYLDMVEPAYIAIDGDGRGTFVFGCVTATLDCSFRPGGVDFTWQGFDEGDEVSGDGWAQIEEDGSLTGEIAFHNGDESTFRAEPW